MDAEDILWGRHIAIIRKLESNKQAFNKQMWNGEKSSDELEEEKCQGLKQVLKPYHLTYIITPQQ